MHLRDVTGWAFIIDGLKIHSNSVVADNDKEFLVKEELKSLFDLPTAVLDIPRQKPVWPVRVEKFILKGFTAMSPVSNCAVISFTSP